MGSAISINVDIKPETIWNHKCIRRNKFRLSLRLLLWHIFNCCIDTSTNTGCATSEIKYDMAWIRKPKRWHQKSNASTRWTTLDFRCQRQCTTSHSFCDYLVVRFQHETHLFSKHDWETVSDSSTDKIYEHSMNHMETFIARFLKKYFARVRCVNQSHLLITSHRAP